MYGPSLADLWDAWQVPDDEVLTFLAFCEESQPWFVADLVRQVRITGGPMDALDGNVASLARVWDWFREQIEAGMPLMPPDARTPYGDWLGNPVAIGRDAPNAIAWAVGFYMCEVVRRLEPTARLIVHEETVRPPYRDTFDNTIDLVSDNSVKPFPVFFAPARVAQWAVGHHEPDDHDALIDILERCWPGISSRPVNPTVWDPNDVPEALDWFDPRRLPPRLTGRIRIATKVLARAKRTLDESAIRALLDVWAAVPVESKRPPVGDELAARYTSPLGLAIAISFTRAREVRAITVTADGISHDDWYGIGGDRAAAVQGRLATLIIDNDASAQVW